MKTDRHQLICVTGMSPQVVTESLYYFWCVAQPQVPVTEVYVVTTSKGQSIAEASLLGTQGEIAALCRDYQLPTISFEPRNIICLRDHQGDFLADIGSREENEAVADQIFSLVRQLTTDKDTRLHASIAGGRKTMGFYLGTAMQFYGRPGDTLSHVLVDAQIEGNPDFYYPDPHQKEILLSNGQRILSEDINIEVAEIPLLLLKNKIPFLDGNETANYMDLIQIAQRQYDSLQCVYPVQISMVSRTLTINDVSINLTPLEFALYLYFARLRQNCSSQSICSACTIKKRTIDIEGELLAQPLRQILIELGERNPRAELTSWGKDTYSRFSETRAKVNKQLRDAIDYPTNYGIINPPFSQREETSYGIVLDKQLIQFT